MGVLTKTQKFKETCEALLEFPEGWGRYQGYGYFLELHNITEGGEEYKRILYMKDHIFEHLNDCLNLVEA